jgi:DNA-binding transcriptional LysR family regulator
MQMKALRYLMAVVEAGSFAGAATGLGLNSSSLTRQISSLEDELGLTLLERSRSGVRLTSGGAAVIIEVRRVLGDLDAIARAARSNGVGRHGELRLGVRVPPVGEVFTALLRAWRHECPDVWVTIHELSDNELCNAIACRRLDVAIIAGYAVCRHLVTTPLFHERLFAAMATDHGLAAGESVNWTDLHGDPILVQEWDSSHASLLGIGLPLRSHPASKQSVLAMVAAGFGLTLATESQAQVQVPGVVYRLIAEENAHVEMQLAWASDAEDTVVGRFISFARDYAPLGRRTG